MRLASVVNTSANSEASAGLKLGNGIWARSKRALCRALVNRKDVQPRPAFLSTKPPTRARDRALMDMKRTDTVTFTIRVGRVADLPKSAKLVWAGNANALGEWDPSQGVEVRIDGDVGEAKVALPVGHYLWKLAVVHADSTVQWEDGELRCLHVPAAALSVAHVAGLEATCIWNDTRSAALKTRVFKVSLTGDLAAVTKHIRGIKAQQEDLSARLSELESHMAARRGSVNQTTVVSVDGLKCNQPRLDKHHGAPASPNGLQVAASQTAKTAADALANAASNLTALVPKVAASDPAVGRVVTALHRAYKGAQVLARELHPRFRQDTSSAASKSGGAKGGAAAQLPATSHRAGAAGCPKDAGNRLNATTTPSPAAIYVTAHAKLSPKQRKVYMHKELVELSRKSSFPALALGCCLSASAHAAKALAHAAGAAYVRKQTVLASAG